MKIPKLLPKKLQKPMPESNDDDDETEVEKVDQTDGQENTENQSEPVQETGQKKDNQAILRLIGDGEKVCSISQHLLPFLKLWVFARPL